MELSTQYIKNDTSYTLIHGGKSRDLKPTTTMADTIEKIVNPGKISLKRFPLMLVRFAWGLKQITRENDNNMPIVCDLRTKIWLKSY